MSLNPVVAISDRLEKLLNEHSSSIVLKDNIAFLKDQLSFVKDKFAALEHENDRLKLNEQKLQETCRNQEIEI